MTIDINELRRLALDGDLAAMQEIIHRLEAAEKERDALRNEIACVKEVEFPRKAQAVADAWKGKCKRLEAERDALRAELDALKAALNKIADGYYKSFEQHEVALRMQEIARKALTAAPKPEESK